MLEGKELEMYNAQGKIVRITCKDGDVLEGYCSEFSTAYDNDEPEEASITLERGKRVKTGKALYPLTEVFESKIERIEHLN